MAKYKITINLDECISAISCIAIADKLWELGPDQKAHLKIGKIVKEGDIEYSIVSEEELKEAGISVDEMKESASVCPTQAIKIEDIED